MPLVSYEANGKSCLGIQRTDGIVPLTEFGEGLPDVITAIGAHHMIIHTDFPELLRVRTVANYSAQKVMDARPLFTSSRTRQLKQSPNVGYDADCIHRTPAQV